MLGGIGDRGIWLGDMLVCITTPVLSAAKGRASAGTAKPQAWFRGIRLTANDAPMPTPSDSRVVKIPAMNDSAVWCLWLAGSYLVGSVPFGLLIGYTRGVDIRQSGSGNVGATNAGRVLGRKWGLICFVLDVLKGLGPTLAYGLCSGLAGTRPVGGGAPAVLGWLIVSTAAVFGHVFPVWLKFKGGKGVATGLGVLLGFWPVLTIPGLLAGVVWLVLVKATGYVSLASVVAACSLPAMAIISGLCWQRGVAETATYAGVGLVLALLIVVRHRGNIQRLRAGTEPKVAWMKR